MASMPKLLLIPGMMCDERLFAPQIAALADRAEVICARLDGPPSIEGLARMLLAEHSGALSLAGLSMGGIVAMEMVRQASDRIERLALLDTNHHADLVERFETRNRQIVDARGGRLATVIADEMRPAYFAAANANDAVLQALVLDMALGLGPDVFERQSIALRDRSDQTDTLLSYDGPALVLCGTEDRLCPLSRHEEIARLLSGSECVFVEQAGHLATLEQPDAVTLALARWLNR